MYIDVFVDSSRSRSHPHKLDRNDSSQLLMVQCIFISVDVDTVIKLKELEPMSWQNEALNSMTIEIVNNLLVG